MHIICLLKFVTNPDIPMLRTGAFNTLPKTADRVLNTDDKSAMACALRLKKADNRIKITVISMAPLDVLEQLRNVVRLGFDQAILISDKVFAGSDTYVTARILAATVKKINYNVIFCGSHSVDSDTSHIPPQLAYFLGDIPFITCVSKLSELTQNMALAETEDEEAFYTWQLQLPALIGMGYTKNYKLPFVRYENIDLPVDERIEIITNDRLQLDSTELGVSGSLTKVARTYAANNECTEAKAQLFVRGDDAAVTVFNFLRKHGFITDGGSK